MNTSRPRIRFATPADREALAVFERAYFPAVAGQRHPGYLFDNEEVATFALTERLSAPRRAFTFVAEEGAKIVGFVSATPSVMTSGKQDPQTMNLQYLAVSPECRRQGIGAALVKSVVTRSLKAQQNLIHAHIPSDQVSFYEGLGWDVQLPDMGFAWIPREGHLRADVADPALGFPLMATKVLRARGVLHTFPYPVIERKPILDASMEAARLVESGKLDASTLDGDTRRMITMGRIEARRRAT